MLSSPVIQSLGVLALASLRVTAIEPLSSKTFSYPDGIPYQVSGSDAGPRGPQSGYNICNSTTEGPNSQCQTMLLNSLDDFCMWSSNLNTGDDTIPDGEAREVAWCTKPGHGTRIIPAGAITGAQWLYAKNYLQVVGYLDQTKVGLQASDDGGELDPHGDDEQGNPLGGIVYSNGFGLTADKYAQQLQSNSKPSTDFRQVIQWVDFIGTGMFCLKMCNPSDKQGDKLCAHTYDRIGCTYNAAADYAHIDGTFQVCDSDDMTFPGVYVSNGVTTTWTQGPESLPVSAPYSPTAPASSNCHTFSSEQLFGSASASPASAPATTTASSVSSSGSSGSSSPSSSFTVPSIGSASIIAGATSRSGTGASPTQTGAALSLHSLPSHPMVVFAIAALVFF